MFRSRNGEPDGGQRDDSDTVARVSLSCEEAERWLTRVYASLSHPVHTAELPGRLARHVEACTDCRSEVEGRALLPVALDARPQTSSGAESSTTDPLFVQSVMGRVRSEPAPVRRRERRLLAWRGVGWRTAAMLLVALGLALLLWEGVRPPSHLGTGTDRGGDGRVAGAGEPGTRDRDPVAWIPAPEIPDASGLRIPDLVSAQGQSPGEFIDPRPRNCQRIPPVRRNEPPAFPEEVL